MQIEVLGNPSILGHSPGDSDAARHQIPALNEAVDAPLSFAGELLSVYDKVSVLSFSFLEQDSGA